MLQSMPLIYTPTAFVATWHFTKNKLFPSLSGFVFNFGDSTYDFGVFKELL